MVNIILQALAIGCVCVLFTACASSKRVMLTPDSAEAARAALLATDAAWGEAGFTDQSRWPRSFWTADAAMGSVTGERQVFGADALVEIIGGVWDRDPAFKLTWRPTHAWVSADGITGCTIGAGTRTRTDSSGDVVSESVRYTGVWRREDGAWRCVLDIDMTDDGAGD